MGATLASRERWIGLDGAATAGAAAARLLLSGKSGDALDWRERWCSVAEAFAAKSKGKNKSNRPGGRRPVQFGRGCRSPIASVGRRLGGEECAFHDRVPTGLHLGAWSATALLPPIGAIQSALGRRTLPAFIRCGRCSWRG